MNCRGVNYANLTQLHHVSSAATGKHSDPIIPSANKSQLPSITIFNAQSLVNKLEEAEVVFTQYDIDIGIVSESWFSHDIPENQLQISNFNMYSNPRVGKKGGGVAIYVHETIPATPITEIKVPDELECMWLKVRPKRLPRDVSAIAICAVYITTKSPYQSLLEEHLLESVDFLRSKYPDISILITGDFNRMEINNICRGNDLYQLVDFPTRKNATLDLMMTNEVLKKHYRKPFPISPLGYSDHSCIVWKPNNHCAKTCKNTRKVQVVKPLTVNGINSFGTWIQGVDWHEVLEANTTQEKADAFYAILDLGMEICFPEKRVRGHSNDKPWVTTHIKSLIKDRQKAFSAGQDQEWRALRNKVKREIEQAKQTYHASKIRDLQKANPRKWHMEIKKVTNNNGAELRLDVPGVDDADEKGKANAINNMFAGISAHIPPLNYNELPSYLPAKSPPPLLQPWDVYSELMKVNPTKSGGPDLIPAKIIREFAYELSVPLTDILNLSFAEGIVPTQWKKGIVVPIPKQSPPSLDKLRPVSLTSIFAKIAEGFVSRWVLDDIGHAIDTRQFGNVPGVSTNHYLLNLIHYLHIGAEEGGNVGTVVLTDFSKAFDLVNHTILITKMIDLGVRSSIVPWLCNFLQNRQQCVRLNKTLSSDLPLNAGVPQGTKLGPIGFQILINDAAKDSEVEYWKYVDDLTFAENKNYADKGHLQHELDKFSDWASANGLKLNPKKCQVFEVKFGRNAPCHSDVSIGSDLLPHVDKAKILGVWLQDDLKWQTQIGEMLKKANRRLFMLRSLKRFGFAQDELEVIYKCYVRPVVEYGDVVWHSGLTLKQHADLERIQRRACRTILGRHFSTYTDARIQCNLDLLKERRVAHCRKFAQALGDNVRTCHLLPPTRLEAHGRSLRNASNLSQFRTRTDRFRNSPVPFFVSLLNSA